MKIQPPGGLPPTLKPDELQKGTSTQSTTGASFAEKLGKLEGPQKLDPTAASPATGVGGTGQAGGPMATHLDAVAREISAGRIQGREQAMQHLVDRIVDSKFGDKLPPNTLAQMKSAVAAQVVSDANLSERIDRLLAQAQQ